MKSSPSVSVVVLKSSEVELPWMDLLLLADEDLPDFEEVELRSSPSVSVVELKSSEVELP